MNTENNTSQEFSQEKKKDYGTHIRVPKHLQIRLKKISKTTGKTQTNVNKEIVELGIRTYYNQQTQVAQ